MTSYNAEQLISSPTHITEHSSSLIDLIFVKNKNHILSSFVADPFIPNLTRFHCPVVVVLHFHKPRTAPFKRRVWVYDRGNYDDYRAGLRTTDWNSLFDNDDLDDTTEKITAKILSIASQNIPNKIITVRPHDIPWMSNLVRTLI